MIFYLHHEEWQVWWGKECSPQIMFPFSLSAVMLILSKMEKVTADVTELKCQHRATILHYPNRP